MDFSRNLKAFLNSFPLKKLNGQQMFLAVAAHLARGDVSSKINIPDIRSHWSKCLLNISYNGSFYNRAQKEGWVDPVEQGVFQIHEAGLQHLEDILGSDKEIGSPGAGRLYIFEKKSTHSFDKFLRSIFAKAKTKALVADSWVDETIFDNVLDSIPKTTEIKLVYGQKRGTFDGRVVRFRKEYDKFFTKKYCDLHDRFLIVDDVGYVLGPSIKDAASNSPALIVMLNKNDSPILSKFFNNLWVKAR